MQAISSDGLAAGFKDVVLEPQRVFRQCLQALSRPGIPVDIAPRLTPIGPLRPATTAILLALADFETTVWLDSAAHAAPEIGAFLRFHTGATICDRAEDADFAVVLDPLLMPGLRAFKQGTPDYPDRSTSVLIQVDRMLTDGPIFNGPGINGTVSFWAAPLPTDFVAQLADNHRSFPCGVDAFLVAPSQVIGLPRSAAINADGDR